MNDITIPMDKLLERYKVSLTEAQQRIFLLELHVEELIQLLDDKSEVEAI